MKKIIIGSLFLISSIGTFAQNYAISGNEIITEQKVKFGNSNALLSKADIDALKIIKDFLNEKTYISQLRIEGHVSGTKNDQQLSEERALAIAAWLIKEGIDCKRLIAVGFGNNKPAEVNTRINFIMAGLRGKMIGGMPEDGGGNVAGDVCNLNKSSR
ncbi:MAG: OmpA family protein [Chitinophagaceae bacterium]|jgi:OOP family OmpA-OmpF porin